MKVSFDYLDESIYDKSDIENVSDAYLQSLVQQIESSK